ncbi:hypothetical protein PENANT_c038G08128 [Penicillium antarcticum]|uniref:FUN14 domain-containing protein n=1 Tax=Penicillium antarcticum TaxID=416450 RepID=A0A1V6PT59_9EURO|nr:uncharacterized protein N7508_002092 [Penicillium antarcticum]KAJ5317584.1 hypothetical protein N7508_002092 [Penicillium antarcticum]OQD80219.1 hypothetical protein PENANT_c038G08128 [Penicillium antarcticum]
MSFKLFTQTPHTLLRLGLSLSIGLGAATLHPTSPFRAAPLQCQYAAPSASEAIFNKDTGSGWAINNGPSESMAQKQKQKQGFLNAESMKQVSLGCVLGLVAGVGLRAFSKALVVIFGMGVVLVEYAASKGYNILPLNRMQKYVKNVDLKRAMSEKRPFKMSFGVMMALAAFAQF